MFQTQKVLITISLFLMIFAFSNSYITITNPKELQKVLPNKIPGKYSVFGSYLYGFKSDAKLFYHFNDKENTDKDYACKPLPAITTQNKETVAVLVDRGDCSFVTKVRNVQNIGGKIAIIVNNKQDDDVIFAMNDDGTGKDINIPGILISQETGDKIKEFILNNKNQDIFINVDNTIDKLTNEIEFNVNFIANDKKVYSMLSQPLIKQLITETKEIKLVPNYVTITHPQYSLTNYIKDSNNCICGGRYCSYGHNFFSDSFLNTINNQNVILESIRQKCIFNLEGSNKYWDYLTQFGRNCLDKLQFDATCSKQVMADNKIDITKVDQCYLSSFSTLENNNSNKVAVNLEEVKNVCTYNTILENDKKLAENRVLDVLPVVFINNNTLFGTWNAENVLEALCANMKNKPDTCYTAISMFSTSERGFSLSNTQIIIFAMFLIALNVSILLFCRRAYHKKEANNLLFDDSSLDKRIGTIVSGYLKLKDTK